MRVVWFDRFDVVKRGKWSFDENTVVGWMKWMKGKERGMAEVFNSEGKIIVDGKPALSVLSGCKKKCSFREHSKHIKQCPVTRELSYCVSHVTVVLVIFSLNK